MAERSKAAVLKTVDVKASWGSNPYLSAIDSFNVPNAFWCVFSRELGTFEIFKFCLIFSIKIA